VALAFSAPLSAPAASGAATPHVGGATIVGNLVAMDDSLTTSWGRDGGVTVPLPNGQDLWLFADTPRWQFGSGSWRMTASVRGSSAGMVKFTVGQRFTARFLEVIPGHPLAKGNKAHPFMANPVLYLPDGSGRVCNKANGGSGAESVRWPTGAALLPDKVNVFVPFVDVCVLSAADFTVQGWGFALYNWKTNKFTQAPLDVFKPQRNGAAIPLTRWYGSPIVVGKTVTMYTTTRAPLWIDYATTLPATAAAFKKIATYASTPMAAPGTFLLSVSPRAKYQPEFTMYMSTDTAGGYQILTSATPRGPWASAAIGSLPRCSTSPQICTSFAIHPELSSKANLIVSYYLPGSGPTIAAHPDPGNHPNFGHIVWASIPV
jgi:hypothetical protein